MAIMQRNKKGTADSKNGLVFLITPFFHNFMVSLNLLFKRPSYFEEDLKGSALNCSVSVYTCQWLIIFSQLYTPHNCLQISILATFSAFRNVISLCTSRLNSLLTFANIVVLLMFHFYRISAAGCPDFPVDFQIFGLRTKNVQIFENCREIQRKIRIFILLWLL